MHKHQSPANVSTDPLIITVLNSFQFSIHLKFRLMCRQEVEAQGLV